MHHAQRLFGIFFDERTDGVFAGVALGDFVNRSHGRFEMIQPIFFHKKCDRHQPVTFVEHASFVGIWRPDDLQQNVNRRVKRLRQMFPQPV
ncbi:MAG: hypothetical protein R3C26_15470 [Calditrichia bacterium]